MVSPCSTSVIRLEAIFRKSVNATFFTYKPPDEYIQLYILNIFCQDTLSDLLPRVATKVFTAQRIPAYIIEEIKKYSSEVFFYKDDIRWASRIVKGILEANSPRVTDIGRTMEEQSEEANCRAVYRFLERTDPWEALRLMFLEDPEKALEAVSEADENRGAVPGFEELVAVGKDDAEEAGHLREASVPGGAGLWNCGAGGGEPSGSDVPGEGEKIEDLLGDLCIAEGSSVDI